MLWCGTIWTIAPISSIDWVVDDDLPLAVGVVKAEIVCPCHRLDYYRARSRRRICPRSSGPKVTLVFDHGLHLATVLEWRFAVSSMTVR